MGDAQFFKLHILEVDALDAGVEIAQQFAEALFQVFVAHGLEHSALLVGRVGEEHFQRVGKPIFHRVEVFGVAHVVAQVAADHLVQEELPLGGGLGEEGEELPFFLFGVEAQQVGEVELTAVGAPVKHGVVRLAGDEVKPFVSDAFGIVAEAVFIAFAAGGDDEDELRVAFAAFGAEAEGAVNDGGFSRGANHHEAFGEVDGFDEIALAHGVWAEEGCGLEQLRLSNCGCFCV